MLSPLEEEKETLEFFDTFLQPLAEVESEMRSGFEAKLLAGKHGEFSVDEVSLFLNVCGIRGLIEYQRQRKFTGEDLELAITDISVLEIKDTLCERKLKFYLKVLGSGKYLDRDLLEKSTIWRHKDVEKTLLLLREWSIELNEQLVREKEISICQLIFFKLIDFRKILDIPVKDATGIMMKLKRLRKQFEKFLKDALE